MQDATTLQPSEASYTKYRTFPLRRILEPQALVSAAPLLEHAHLAGVFARFRQVEAAFDGGGEYAAARDLEAFETLLIETCVLATPNDRIARADPP